MKYSKKNLVLILKLKIQFPTSHHDDPPPFHLLITVAIGLLLTCATAAGADVSESRLYFVRHGQTFSNVGSKPITGDAHALNELGQQQAEQVVPQLKPYTFDRIAVSTMDRAIATLLPYLRSTGKKAEVWPELAECCYQKERELPAIGIQTKHIIVFPDFAKESLFFPTDGGNRVMWSETYQDGLDLVRLAAARVEAVLKTPGQNLLIGGHSLNGGRMIELLTQGKFTETVHLENGKLTIIRRDADGSYTLEMRNSVPVAAP